jgi:hypothetical protein
MFIRPAPASRSQWARDDDDCFYGEDDTTRTDEEVHLLGPSASQTMSGTRDLRRCLGSTGRVRATVVAGDVR